MDFFFLDINGPVAEVGLQSLHFPRDQDGFFLINAIWFVRVYVIHNSSWKIGFKNNATSFFMSGSVSILGVQASQ